MKAKLLLTFIYLSCTIITHAQDIDLANIKERFKRNAFKVQRRVESNAAFIIPIPIINGREEFAFNSIYEYNHYGFEFKQWDRQSCIGQKYRIHKKQTAEKYKAVKQKIAATTLLYNASQKAGSYNKLAIEFGEKEKEQGSRDRLAPITYEFEYVNP